MGNRDDEYDFLFKGECELLDNLVFDVTERRKFS